MFRYENVENETQNLYCKESNRKYLHTYSVYNFEFLATDIITNMLDKPSCKIGLQNCFS